MEYRIIWWKGGERIVGAPMKEREATLHAALHLHAGEKADETRVYERELAASFLFGYNERVIMTVTR